MAKNVIFEYKYNKRYQTNFHNYLMLLISVFWKQKITKSKNKEILFSFLKLFKNFQSNNYLIHHRLY